MSAKSQSQAEPDQSQVATQPSPATAEVSALQRQCVGGCGNHTVGGGVCGDCRRNCPPPATPPALLNRPAVTRAGARRPPSASGAAAREDERPPVQAERDFTGVRASAAVINIKDDDPVRAEMTRRLLERLAQQLGLNPDRLEIRTDREAARHADARGARGTMEGGVVYLDPRRYDPRTREGAYLIGHEVVHVAQRAHANGRSAGKVLLAEIEAHELGRAFADGRVIEQPKIALPASHAAADAGMDELESLVASNHRGELARIHALLQRGFLDWAITDGDVTEILTILSLFPFVVARALVSALPDEDQYRLIDNLDTPHYKIFRAQILAAYWGTKTEVLNKFGADLLTPLDLHDLDPLEIHAVKDVFDRLNPSGQSRLREHPTVGPVIAEIEEFTGTTSTESIARVINDALNKAVKGALEEETKLQEARAAAAATYELRSNELKPVVDQIKTKMSKFWVRDEDALEVLDMLAEKYSDQPEMLRAIADQLVEDKSPPEHAPHEYQEKDYLDELIRQTPISKLYVEGSRRVVFLQLLSFRPPHKNEAIAEEIISTSFFVPVSAEEAYLAFLLVKAMPERARAAFFRSEGGEKWTTVFDEMSLQMRESETLNLYTGGKEDKDRESILIQLLSDEIWQNPDTSRLDALVRMAIAAGEHQFVFEQSAQRLAYSKGGDKLKALVEKYKLYNPDEKRLTYRPEVLDEDAEPSMLWGLLRFLFGSDSIYLDRLVGGVVAGGEGLNLEAAQDVIGGSLKGVRLTTSDEREQRNGTDAKTERGTNRVKANYLGAEKFAEVHADQLDIAAIHYPIGDTKLQTGAGSIRNLTLRIRGSAAGFAAPAMVDLYAGELVFHDVLLIKPDSMKGINTFDMRGLSLLAGSTGTNFDRLKASRGPSGTPVPVFAGIVYVMHLGTATRGLDGIVKGEEPATPTLPLEFDLSFDSIKLVGVTTSGGQFVESIELKDFSLRGGGDINVYRKALADSALRLEARLKQENSAFAAAESALDLSRHADAAAQLQRQLDRTRAELEHLKAAEAEVLRLEEKQKSAPDTFTAADRIKLRRLKASLSGAVLDVGSIVIKGVAGYEAEGADGTKTQREIKLDDVHGQGRGATSALGVLGDPDQLRTLLGGASARTTYKGEGTEQTNFTLDIGHVEVPNVMLKGEIPSAKVAERDYRKFEAAHDPWRPSHVAELARLKKRCDLAAERDRLLQEVGIRKFDAAQRKRFSELSTELDALEKQGATTVGLILMEGTTLEFGGGEVIGVGAAKFNATDIRKGATHIAGVSGENVQIGVEVTGGLTGLDEWREKLRKLMVKGDSLVATGITHEDMGVTIDRASLLGIDEASIDNKDKSASARLKTKMVLIEGVHLRNIEDTLIREENYLKSFHGPPMKCQRERLQSITASLDELKTLRAALGKAEAKLAAAKSKQGKLAAQAAVEEAQKKLDNWAEQLVTKQVSVANADVTLSGLGDIFSADWNPDQAVEKGIRLGGHIDDLSVEGVTWQDATKRVFSTGKSSLTGIDVTGAVYSKRQIKVGSFSVGAFTGDHLGYIDKTSGMEITVTSGGFGGIKVNDLVVDLPENDDCNIKISGGKAAIEKVNQLSLGLKMLSKGIQASGVLSGSAISVDFVTSDKRVYRIGDLSLAEGRFTQHKKGEKLPDTIRFSLKKFSAKTITEEKVEDGGRKLTLDDIKIANFDVGKSLITDGGKRLEINGRASLKGASLSAEVLLDKENTLKRFKVRRLYVHEISATNVHAESAAVAADPAKSGDTGTPKRAIDLDSAAIKGLEIEDIDLAEDFSKMVGTATIKDSVDIDNLRVTVGDRGWESLKAGLSVKVFGKGQKEGPGETGLRGRELRATLMGPKGLKFELGTIQKISGDIDAHSDAPYGAARDHLSTKFGTGLVTLGPILVAADGSSIKVSDILVKDVRLTAPRFIDKHGTIIEITNDLTVPTIKIGSVVALFDVSVDAAGKKSGGMRDITVKDLNFDIITAKGFSYSGASTISGVTRTKTDITADTATLTNLNFSLLSHDVSKRLSTINATLQKTTVDNFVGTFSKTVNGHDMETRFFSNIEAGGMEAKLTLKGTSIGKKPHTELDGFFKLTDPAKGLGLTNMRVEEYSGGQRREILGALDPKETAGLDLTGLHVKLSPDGTILTAFDALAVRNIKAEIAGAKIGLALAEIKGLALGVKGALADTGIKQLGLSLQSIKAKGLDINYEIDRRSPSKPSTTPAGWILAPLDQLDGTIAAVAYDIDAKVMTVDRANVSLPVSGGVIDFDQASIEIDWLPDPHVGISREGIYVDHAAGRKNLYENPAMAGATPETVHVTQRGQRIILSRGKLNLRQFLEGEMNKVPDPAAPTTPAGRLDFLNTLDVSGSGLKMGNGRIGTKDGSVELQGRGAGKNVLNITSARIGRHLEISLPQFSATRGKFEAKGRKGETGDIDADIKVTITGLGAASLKFNINLKVEEGTIKDITFGDVGIRTEAEKLLQKP